tara:strand:+ start:1033 stop:1722 length:690 start_codon:yes stop_codon:yes gene_type:complete
MPGAILYQGPSLFDGKPIVVIAVWSSANRKTGDMLQTYIIRSDIDPREANKYGEDESICGQCRHRGTPTFDPLKKLAEGRTCYVTLGQGPLIVFDAFIAGKYPVASPRTVGRKRKVRIGTYGDGAAAPRYVWDELLSEAEGHTAYTHNGGDPAIYMVSVDTLAEAKAAWASNHRTFRVIPIGVAPEPEETMCPSLKGVHCEDCLLCDGEHPTAKSIAIPVHGSGAVHFQ